MIQVNSTQFNYSYGGEIRFPYSIGALVAYLKSKGDLSKHFKFEKTFVFRDRVEEYIQQCKNTDILLCSCYAWNWEIGTYLAKEVKKINPKCVIILGGPNVPNYSEGFFKKYPYIDILVHGEGEYIIENIFKAYLKDKDYSKIKGIETKEFRTEPQPRINDLEELPSPYLTNVVWELVEKEKGVTWVAPWETNRGCPYACTFCDWGSATNTKMRKWSEEKLFKEIEWFADNKTTYIDCCDANFGIFQDRDFRIASKVKNEKREKGFPLFFRPTWAKFSSDKIIPIAKELQGVGLLRAVTLALQSLDETTLDIIKRANIKFDKFSELTDTFSANNIPTYTELIMGLPGETVESWKKGLEIILSDSKIGTIYIYNCAVFPNSPMNEPNYKKYYEIKTIRSPIYLAHTSKHDNSIPEYEDISISTSSFTLDELKEMYLFTWATLTLHHLGILEVVSKYYHQVHNLQFMKFNEALFEYCNSQHSIFSDEYEKVVNHRDDGLAGKGWNHFDSELGDINWPIEEATWLRFASNKSKLEIEILSFLKFLENKYNFCTNENILKDLAKFQTFVLSTRDDIREVKSDNFEYDWKSFFVSKTELKQIKKSYYYNNKVLENDPLQWVIKTIWYGRISKKYKCVPEDLQEGKPKMELAQIVTE